MAKVNTLMSGGKIDYSINRRKQSQSIYRWSRRSKLLLVGVGFSLITIFFLILFFGIRVYSLNKENESLRENLKYSEKELNLLKPEVLQLREDLKALVENRIPRLKKLEYDKVIPLDAEYLKNIVFTLTKDGQKQYYEYKLVMENNTPFVIWPELKIYFFDELGIQVGVEEIGTSKETLSAEGKHSLGSGEVRSHSSRISLSEDEAPVYFMIRVRDEQNAGNFPIEESP